MSERERLCKSWYSLKWNAWDGCGSGGSRDYLQNLFQCRQTPSHLKRYLICIILKKRREREREKERERVSHEHACRRERGEVSHCSRCVRIPSFSPNLLLSKGDWVTSEKKKSDPQRIPAKSQKCATLLPPFFTPPTPTQDNKHTDLHTKQGWSSLTNKSLGNIRAWIAGKNKNITYTISC